MSQSASNYLRFYAPHHFVFYPLASVLLFISVYFAFTRPETTIWIFISLLFAALVFLAFMTRQHYALTLQDRVIRLELRYRYFALTGKRLEEFEPRLRDRQLFALRFCSDAELPAMVQTALNENLSGSKIKRAIINWKADHHRV